MTLNYLIPGLKYTPEISRKVGTCRKYRTAGTLNPKREFPLYKKRMEEVANRRNPLHPLDLNLVRAEPPSAVQCLTGQFYYL